MNSAWIRSSLNHFDWQQFGTAALNSILYIVIILVISRVAYWLIIYLLQRTLLDHKGKKSSMNVRLIQCSRFLEVCRFI